MLFLITNIFFLAIYIKLTMDRHVQDDYGQKYRQTCAVSLWTKVQTDLNMMTMDKVQTDLNMMTMDKVQTDLNMMTMDRSTDRLEHDDYG
jgi:hypothetical protein